MNDEYRLFSHLFRSPLFYVQSRQDRIPTIDLLHRDGHLPFLIQGDKVMKYFVIASICVWIFTPAMRANTGYFAGSGQTITLGKTEQIQLVSEEVTIRAKMGWEPQSDSVIYRCKFVLKNRSKQSVKAQVGFPLDSQFVQKRKDPSDTLDLVMHYSFIARDSDKTYHIRFVPRDSEKRFHRLFVWDMEFDAGETKVLYVAYEIPMSEALTFTCKPELIKNGEYLHHEKPWHAYLEMAFVENFQYVTETGKSWSGPINKASFRIDFADLESCLEQRQLFPPGTELPEPKNDGSDWPESVTLPVKNGPLYKTILPDGGQNNIDDWSITWEYNNYKPGNEIVCIFYVLPLPRTADDCDFWVRHVLGKNPAKPDLEEMREIVAAFYGIIPQSKSAKEFAERQIWYHPQKGLQEMWLPANKRAVLKRLDAIIKIQK
jgi:hypothetical protein